MWSNERELEFLECYQGEAVLWNSKDVKHKDKQTIHDAWVRISEQMETPVAELKKKRDSLMATYRGHKRKVIASIQSGAAADSVYKPIWFAYELMDSFLNNIVQCRKTLNTDTQNSPESGMSNEAEHYNPESASTTSSPLPTIPRRRKNPIELEEAGKSMKEAMTSLNKILNKQELPEDDFDRYGKILANKLRKLSESDSIKMMYEIDGLFIKRMNATPSYFTRPSPTYSFHSEPTQRLHIPYPATSPTHYVRPDSACTSYSDPEVQTSRSSLATSTSSNVIKILSDEIISPPANSNKVIQISSDEIVSLPANLQYNTDIVNQAFYKS
ncbi:uncharacterized protein LOC112049189 [Bicyclus anynana]|uniref:Uncharacterized protein LOC112049189 n=1 Tax=Bicyclus anynana TaxID=110368 RepID=A0A6J1N7B1_BICAN|nr:uncharacterized protein LOC112049189 [Bicyclus anynana]